MFRFLSKLTIFKSEYMMVKKTLTPKEARDSSIVGIVCFFIIASVVNLVPIAKTENATAIKNLINIISVPCIIILLHDVVVALAKICVSLSKK